MSTRVSNLSGGNQQKTIFAKWLHADCRVLLIDEPTRGVDVGAKREIWQLLSDLAARGVGILMVSSELPEVLAVSDRILVMRDGAICGELSRPEATEERIMQFATRHAA
jgi:ribose transport system ATP-binding protein